ncbi:hypothetical protein D3C83_180800 [compost metagenome]
MTNSRTLRAGTEGCTTSAVGPDASLEIGAKSFIRSKPRFGNSVVLMAAVTLVINSV